MRLVIFCSKQTDSRYRSILVILGVITDNDTPDRSQRHHAEVYGGRAGFFVIIILKHAMNAARLNTIAHVLFHQSNNYRSPSVMKTLEPHPTMKTWEAPG